MKDLRVGCSIIVDIHSIVPADLEWIQGAKISRKFYVF